MSSYTIERTGEKVELTDNHFKAKGGEGSIYIIGDTVYKVCHPGMMIPEQKLKELKVLDHPNIIVPKDILFQRKKPVGYTMQAVPGNPYALAQIMTKAFREREGVTPDQMMKLVAKIANIIRFIHKHDGFLQVDGNEFNYMVNNKFDEIFAIDTNSYQTPSFPAEVIMASIQDLHAEIKHNRYVFTQLTDWYSFAIISFYMFTAIHPFRGHHPSNTNMKTLMYDNMLHCKSVLDPETTYPLGAIYQPFEDYIPGGKDGAYMQWYKQVFINNKRLPAPEHWQAVLNFVVRVKEIIGSNNFKIQELKRFYQAIIGFYTSQSKTVVVTKNKIHIGGSEIDHPHTRFRVGFTPKRNVPYAAWLDDNENLNLLDLENNTKIKCNLNGSNISHCEGRVYVQSHDRIYEIDFIEAGTLIAVPKPIATILPNATNLYQGVAIQDMFGNYMVSLFTDHGFHRQITINELKDYRVVEAKYENRVLMVLVASKTGQYDRLIFRFSDDWKSYDFRKIEDITPSGLNFTVLDKGLVACLTEEEKLEIFFNKKDHVDVKLVEDPVLENNMHLCHVENQMQFARGNMLYSISLAK